MLEEINIQLTEDYGRGLQDLPKYRVVWSTDETEIRTAVYSKFTEAGIYLGEEKKTCRTHKYPLWKDYWILEYVQPNLANPELKANWSYEPIYIFKDGNERPLPLNWEVIQTIIFFHINGMGRKAPTASEILHEYEEQLEREKADMLDYLQHDEAFPNKMYDSKVVTIPHKRFED